MVRLFSLLLAVGLMSHHAVAAGGAYRPLDSVIAASGDIVVATITDGQASGLVFSVSLQIESVLKGASLAPGTTTGAEGAVSDGQSYGAARNRGVFFLSGSGGTRRLVPLVSGSVDETGLYIPLAATAGGPLQGNSVREQILLELLRTIESNLPLPFPPAIDVVSEYRSNPSVGITDVWRRWITGGSPQCIQIGFQALLSVDDVAALKSLTSNPALTSPDSKNTVFTPEVIGGIFRALEQYHGSDSVSVATLGGLAATSSLPGALRKSAARALANIHTQQSLPYLAGLLNEQDVGLVTAGLGGLSAFANNLAIGVHEPRDGKYQTAETIAHSVFDERAVSQRTGYYVVFWKDWWQQNQKELLQ